MTTINIHKDKLLPAAFAYQQRKLKEIMCRRAGGGLYEEEVSYKA